MKHDLLLCQSALALSEDGPPFGVDLQASAIEKSIPAHVLFFFF